MKITNPNREIVRQRFSMRRLDYHELEPRQLLAAIHGHADQKIDNQGPIIEVHSRDIQNRQSFQFNQNDSPSQRGSTTPNRSFDANRPTNSSQNRLPTSQTISALNSSPVTNAQSVQIPTLVNSKPQRNPSSIVLSEPNRTSNSGIDANQIVGALRIELSPATVSGLPFLADERDDRQDESLNESETNIRLASVSPAEFEMLIGEIESDQNVRDQIDEYFSMFGSASGDTETLAANLNSDLTSPFDALEREQKSLDGILSELYDFNGTENGYKNPANDYQIPYSAPRAEPIADPNLQNDTPAEKHPSSSKLAEVLDGGMVLLGINGEYDATETDELFEFLTHGMKVELPVADVQIEMSVGVVQNFDIGSREQNVSVEDVAAAVSPATAE